MSFSFFYEPGIDDHLEDGELIRALQESLKNEHPLCQNVLLGGVFSYVTPSVQCHLVEDIFILFQNIT